MVVTRARPQATASGPKGAILMNRPPLDQSSAAKTTDSTALRGGALVFMGRHLIRRRRPAPGAEPAGLRETDRPELTAMLRAAGVARQNPPRALPRHRRVSRSRPPLSAAPRGWPRSEGARRRPRLPRDLRRPARAGSGLPARAVLGGKGRRRRVRADGPRRVAGRPAQGRLSRHRRQCPRRPPGERPRLRAGGAARGGATDRADAGFPELRRGAPRPRGAAAQDGLQAERRRVLLLADLHRGARRRSRRRRLRRVAARLLEVRRAAARRADGSLARRRDGDRRVLRRRAVPLARLPRFRAQTVLSGRPRRADGRDGHARHLSRVGALLRVDARAPRGDAARWQVRRVRESQHHPQRGWRLPFGAHLPVRLPRRRDPGSAARRRLGCDLRAPALARGRHVPDPSRLRGRDRAHRAALPPRRLGGLAGEGCAHPDPPSADRRGGAAPAPRRGGASRRTARHGGARWVRDRGDGARPDRRGGAARRARPGATRRHPGTALPQRHRRPVPGRRTRQPRPLGLDLERSRSPGALPGSGLVAKISPRWVHDIRRMGGRGNFRRIDQSQEEFMRTVLKRKRRLINLVAAAVFLCGLAGAASAQEKTEPQTGQQTGKPQSPETASARPAISPLPAFAVIGPSRELKFAENTWFRFGAQVQGWFRIAQDRNATASDPQGTYAMDYYCRRCRFFATGSVVKDVYFNILFEAANFGRFDATQVATPPNISTKTLGVPQILDAYGQVRFAD